MWKMLQKKKPEDYIIATGKNYSVKDFIKKSLKILDIKVKWKGSGINTKAYTLDGKCIIECKKKIFQANRSGYPVRKPNQSKKRLKMATKDLI